MPVLVRSFIIFYTITHLSLRCSSARYIYWGLARLASDGPLGSIPRGQVLSETQQDEFQYVFDGNACGEGVTIYVLGMWFNFLSFNRLVVTLRALLDTRKSKSSDER